MLHQLLHLSHFPYCEINSPFCPSSSPHFPSYNSPELENNFQQVFSPSPHNPQLIFPFVTEMLQNQSSLLAIPTSSGHHVPTTIGFPSLLALRLPWKKTREQHCRVSHLCSILHYKVSQICSQILYKIQAVHLICSAMPLLLYSQLISPRQIILFTPIYAPNPPFILHGQSPIFHPQLWFTSFFLTLLNS